MRGRWIAAALVVSAVGGCTTRTASLTDTSTIPPPSFVDAAAQPADSPQLDAVVLRDTGGLENPDPDVDPRLIGEAINAVNGEFPGLRVLADLFASDGSVHMRIPDPDSPARTIQLHYRAEDRQLFVNEPQFNDGVAFFPISAVRPDAITALVDGLIEAYPTLQVDLPRLDVALSFDLGLSWRVDLRDARGLLATVFADLDGRVIAVDMEDR